LRSAKATGFSAIELACAKPHLDFEALATRAAPIAAEIREAGLDVAALSLHNRFTEEERKDVEVKAAAAFIRAAPLFGTRLVKMTPGFPSSRDATQAHWDRLADCLEKLTPIARSAGVRLAFETYLHMVTDTLDSSLRFLGLADPDVVGLTVDFCNLAFAGESMDQVVHRLKDRTWHVHVKNGRVADSGEYLWQPLDQGLVDYVETVALLRSTGYDGYLSIECHDPFAKMAPVAAAARDLSPDFPYRVVCGGMRLACVHT